MPNYQNGKIYAIRSHQTDNIYIGSTCSPLYKRFYDHKANYKSKKNKINYSSFKIVKYDDAYIELLEEYPCNSKEELNKKEGEYIRSMDCVNKEIAGRTEKEYKEENKEHYKQLSKKYRKENKEHLKEYIKKYRKENKEHLKEWGKKYYSNLDNKKKAIERAKEYNKKPEVIEKRKQKYNCECGGKYQYSSKAEHMRCKKHMDYVNNNIDN